MLKILHTADWHLGYVTQLFDEESARKLARARLEVIHDILGLAGRHDVHAVLCAGDLFDTPEPDASWWQGLLDVFRRNQQVSCPIVLLPGNHDPIRRGSVYDAAHPFRRGLPPHVRVVDKKGFSLELAPNAVLFAAPCTTTAGDLDLASSLPDREPGDERIRIGLVHGSTFDLAGYETNFPIPKDAAERRKLDYLAIGDTHSVREVTPKSAAAPIFYPGAPEPTGFGEDEAGFVLLVTFSRAGRRPSVHKERVGRWTWRDEKVQRLAALRSLAEDSLESTALRVHLDLDVNLEEQDEVERILNSLAGSEAVRGRAGALSVDRSDFRLDVAHASLTVDVPEPFRDAESALRARAEHDPIAKRALVILYRMVREESA